MNKCYITGKITGIPEAEYRAKFRSAEIAVAILGYEAVNPCEQSQRTTMANTRII